MDIQVNIFSIDGDCYGLYNLRRMDKAGRKFGLYEYLTIEDGEICWKFISFHADNSYPTIYVDDDDRSYIKFKPEHLSDYSPA